MGYTKFGSTWWGKNWLNALKSIYHSNRLPRGRSYARSNAVRSVKIHKSVVNAKVKGRLPKPYRINIEVPLFTKTEKQKIENIVLSNPYFVSRMLAGELPPVLLDNLQAEDIHPFPQDSKDIETSCSCPDWANPCKHIAAVIYLIASQIDKDPFLVFKLKGLDIEQALKNTKAAKVEKKKKTRP